MPQIQLNNLWSENFGFKIIALLITIVLWLTMLGRREVLYSKEFTFDVDLPQHLVLVGQTSESVELKLSGARSSVKKYIESLPSDQLRIELPDAHEGLLEFEVRPERFNLPSGLRIQSIKPSRVRLEVMTVENFKKLNKNGTK